MTRSRNTPALASPRALWHGAAMTPRRNTAAGGIFLFLAPVLGLLYGLGRGDPIKWMLLGFAIGVALALLTWIVDRRRR